MVAGQALAVHAAHAGVLCRRMGHARLEDELLGPLGGIFHGTIVDWIAGREVLVADAYWLPTMGDPIGPMTLEIRCTALEGGTVLSLRQSGWDNSPRWTRYYEILERSLPVALGELKRYLEELHAPLTG